MRSFRSWLIGLALGASLLFGAPMANAQGVPRCITYQGMLLNGLQPFTGTVDMQITFDDGSGGLLFSETIKGVMVTNGIFNILLGDPASGGLPQEMLFDRLMSFTIAVNSSSTIPAQLLWSAPYSLNTQRAVGIDVSPVPVRGNIFPMPLNGSGKISLTMLPEITSSLFQNSFIQTVDGVGPSGAGNINLVGANGITLATTPGSNQLTINEIADGQITSVSFVDGVYLSEILGNNKDDLYFRIASGGISDSMLAPTLVMGNSANNLPSLAVQDSEANGNEAVLVKGGIGANNPTGATDGSGLTSGSPQTYWADQVSVPAGTGTSLQIYNKLIAAGSRIVILPYGLSASVGQMAITSQGTGTFTVSSTSTMGTSGGGSVAAINYLVVN